MMWKNLPSLPALSARTNVSYKAQQCEDSLSVTILEKPLDKRIVQTMLNDPASTEGRQAREQVLKAIVDDDESFRAFQRELRQSKVHTHNGVKALIHDPVFAKKMGQRALRSKTEAKKRSQTKALPSPSTKRATSATRTNEEQVTKPCLSQNSLGRANSLSSSAPETLMSSYWSYMKDNLPPVSVATLEGFFLIAEDEKEQKGGMTFPANGRRSYSISCAPMRRTRLSVTDQDCTFCDDDEADILRSQSLNLHSMSRHTMDALTKAVAASALHDSSTISLDASDGSRRSSRCSLKNFFPPTLSTRSSYRGSSSGLTLGAGDDSDEPSFSNDNSLCVERFHSSNQRASACTQLANLMELSFSSETSFDSQQGANMKPDQLFVEWSRKDDAERTNVVCAPSSKQNVHAKMVQKAQSFNEKESLPFLRSTKKSNVSPTSFTRKRTSISRAA